MSDAAGAERAVIVICDSLRADLITPDDTPFLVGAGRARRLFRGASQRLPVDDAGQRRLDRDRLPAGAARALGNTMALDEGDGLVCRSAGAPDFRDRMRRATGRTLHVPTLAERLRWHGEDLDLLRQRLAGRGLFPGSGRAWLGLPRGRQLRPGPRADRRSGKRRR